MKNAVGFFGGLVAWALFVLFVFAEPAHAQEVSNVISQGCNIALTDCTFDTDMDQAASINPSTALHYPVTPVIMEVLDNAAGTDITYSGGITAGVVTRNTLYARDTEYTFTFTPAATLVATYRLRRSGSGRGGWAWHQSWLFQTLTVY